MIMSASSSRWITLLMFIVGALVAQLTYLFQFSSYNYMYDNHEFLAREEQSNDDDDGLPLLKATTNTTTACRPRALILQQEDQTFASLYAHWKPLVLNQTLHYLQDIFAEQAKATLTLLQSDVEELSQHAWHSPRLVQRSTVHSLSAATLQRLHTILANRRQDPSLNPPLHIMVLGGSIVLGNGAGLYRNRNGSNVVIKANNTLARWSTQFEQLVNRLLFASSTSSTSDQIMMIQVTNMANGGMTTGISSIPLKYQIFPKGVRAPDLIIASFGYNDIHMMLAQHQNPVLAKMTLAQQEVYLMQETQRFVRAALQANGICTDEPPAVLLVDDSFLIPQANIRTNLLHSRVVAEVAAWYNVGAVSWTKTMMHRSYSSPKLSNLSRDGPDDILYWPLWGGNVRTSHPNILFHVGIAWLLFYQFVLQLSLPCEEDELQHATAA
jgi:hypothetical protein